MEISLLDRTPPDVLKLVLVVHVLRFSELDPGESSLKLREGFYFIRRIRVTKMSDENTDNIMY